MPFRIDRTVVAAVFAVAALTTTAFAGPCGPGNGDCCQGGRTPGCDDLRCCTLICGIDPFCCDAAWDGICADQASKLGGICAGPLLTRAEAASILLSDLSGVPINLIDANVWSPFRDYGFGPGREGLLPPGSRVDPGNTPLDPGADPGMLVGPPSYLFWINDGNPAAFAHDTRFVLIDATHPNPTKGKGILVQPYRWWPIVVLPDKTSEGFFETVDERVTNSLGSPTNPEGLIEGPATSPGDITAVPPAKTVPEPNNIWALVWRGSSGSNFEANLNRFKKDLKDHYDVPEDNTVTKGDRGQMPGTKQDLKDAITELCRKIEDSGKPCDKIYVRLTAHGDAGGKLMTKDGHFTKAELATEMKRLAKKGTPICLLIHACHSGGMLDPHNWDFPAGSSVITATDAAGAVWSDNWVDQDTGDAISGGLYGMAFSECLNSDVNAIPSADKNDDDFIDECEAHDWVIAQNPSWQWPGNDQKYNGTRANPQKRVVGLSASGLNVNVCNNTGATKTDFHIVFKGDVTGGIQHAWRSTADDNIGDRWAVAGESAVFDAAEDETTVSWEDPNDPILPGQYVHFGYFKSGLKPIRQRWTPGASLDGGLGERAPISESSRHASGDESELIIRTITRSDAAGGTGFDVSVDLFYRVSPVPLELVELNLVSMDASGLTPQPLGTVTLTPDTPLISVLQMPADIGPADTLILEAHSSWGLNANTSIEILQFRAIFVPCPWDCEPAPDGQVGITDFLALLGQWGQVNAICDFDGGGVGIIDFLGLLANWGACP